MLSEFEKKAVVLGVYLDTDKNSENLSSATPQDVTWSLKVLAAEHKLISELAAESGWPELSRWFKTNSDALVALIRGERTMQQYSREQEVRKVEYQRIVNQFMSRNQRHRSLAQSDEFSSLRKDLSSFIGASARVFNSTGSG